MTDMRSALKENIDLTSVYEKLPIALCVIDREGRLIAVNELHTVLAGRDANGLIGVKVADLHDEGGRNIIRDFQLFDAGMTVPNHEIEIRGRHYMVSVSPLHDPNGSLAAISVAHFDITEKKATERKVARINRKLSFLSSHDYLTRLGNRRAFDALLDQKVREFIADRRCFALMLFDIDRFKAYNDSYGHQNGDACLQRVAKSMTKVARKGDPAFFRYGGEEFAALISDADQDIAWKIADRVRAKVKELAIPHCRSPLGIVTVSGGVVGACCLPPPNEADFTRELLFAADHALYQAKMAGRDNIQRFARRSQVFAETL